MVKRSKSKIIQKYLRAREPKGLYRISQHVFIGRKCTKYPYPYSTYYNFTLVNLQTCICNFATYIRQLNLISHGKLTMENPMSVL
jgi:hypothetical protein